MRKYAHLRRYALALCALAIAAAVPLAVHSNYSLRLFNLSLIFALLSISLNIVLGYAGQIALGHAALFGIGAYTSALITAGAGGEWFWPAFVASGLTTGLAGLLIGIPTLRLRGHYLALATLGFGEIMRLIFFNWREVTHGMDGISAIPSPAIGSFAFDTETRFYYLSLTMLTVAMVVTHRIARSKYGRMFASVRDSELGAGAAGVNVPRLKIIAFAISAVLAGFSGSLYAHLVAFISPDVFIFDVTAQILSMVLIGGIGTTAGPVIGAVVLTFGPELLRISKAYYLVMYGAGIAAMIIFLPGGLVGLWNRWLSHTRRAQNSTPEPVAAFSAPSLSPPNPTPLPTTDRPASEPILVIENLTCRFGGLVAIADLNLSVRRGSIHGLIGPNGSGKSTLINLVTGLYRANAGSISFDGQPIHRMSPWRIADRGLMRTFQHLKVFSSLTVAENVMISVRAARAAGWIGVMFDSKRARQEAVAIRQQADQALRVVGLWHLRDRVITTLPHEQQRLVEIARVLAIGPKLIMLDEPAAGMGAADASRLAALIRSMRDSGITILLVEHNIPMVMSLADTVTVLNFGRKIAEGEPDAVRRDAEVMKAYLGQRLAERLNRNAAA
jgi:branched-chain amino acid transport system permease protein